MGTPTPYPLTWPEGMKRAAKRETGQFKTQLAGAMKNVQDSLRRFGQLAGKPVSGVVISSNVSLGNNRPPDPGVAIWFTWEETQICIPVDRYSTVEANLQAIHHILEARCTELRHGTLELMRATFKGLQALPPPNDWRKVLRFESVPAPTKEQLEARYRYLAKAAADDPAELTEINIARDRAKQELGL